MEIIFTIKAGQENYSKRKSKSETCIELKYMKLEKPKYQIQIHSRTYTYNLADVWYKRVRANAPGHSHIIIIIIVVYSL